MNTLDEPVLDTLVYTYNIYSYGIYQWLDISYGMLYYPDSRRVKDVNSEIVTNEYIHRGLMGTTLVVFSISNVYNIIVTVGH